MVGRFWRRRSFVMHWAQESANQAPKGMVVNQWVDCQSPMQTQWIHQWTKQDNKSYLPLGVGLIPMLIRPLSGSHHKIIRCVTIYSGYNPIPVHSPILLRPHFYKPLGTTHALLMALAWPKLISFWCLEMQWPPSKVQKGRKVVLFHVDFQ